MYDFNNKKSERGGAGWREEQFGLLLHLPLLQYCNGSQNGVFNWTVLLSCVSIQMVGVFKQNDYDHIMKMLKSLQVYRQAHFTISNDNIEKTESDINYWFGFNSIPLVTQ